MWNTRLDIYQCAPVASYTQAAWHAQDTTRLCGPLLLSIHSVWIILHDSNGTKPQHRTCPVLQPLSLSHTSDLKELCCLVITTLSSACVRFASCCLCGSLPVCSAVAVSVLEASGVVERSDFISMLSVLLKFFRILATLFWRTLYCDAILEYEILITDLAVIASCPVLPLDCAHC